MPARTVSNRATPRSAANARWQNLCLGIRGAGRKCTASRMLLCLALGAFVIVVGAVCALAENTAPLTHSGKLTPKSPAVLPKTCLSQEHPSDKIAALTESIQDHATAGAYNTLGVLFAQADRLA